MFLFTSEYNEEEIWEGGHGARGWRAVVCTTPRKEYFFYCYSEWANIFLFFRVIMSFTTRCQAFKLQASFQLKYVGRCPWDEPNCVLMNGGVDDLDMSSPRRRQGIPRLCGRVWSWQSWTAALSGFIPSSFRVTASTIPERSYQGYYWGGKHITLTPANPDPSTARCCTLLR